MNNTLLEKGIAYLQFCQAQRGKPRTDFNGLDLDVEDCNAAVMDEIDRLRKELETANKTVEFYSDTVQHAVEVVDILLAALNKIANPIKTMQQEAEKQGYKISAGGLIALINDPTWYQEVADKALKTKEAFSESVEEEFVKLGIK